MIKVINFKKYNFRNYLGTMINGFGVVELILSSSILVIIVLLSVYFTSIRQKVIRDAYIRNAIENEIQRDIENIRGIMWRNSYLPSDGSIPSAYDVNKAKEIGLCRDIKQALSNKVWSPQLARNKIIKNNIKIIRNVSSQKPLGLQSPKIDNSISRINYIVEYDNKKVEWMNFDIGSEVHSWCPPGVYP